MTRTRETGETFVHALTHHDRALLAALSRYLRTAGFQPAGWGSGVWRKNGLYVVWDKAERCLEVLWYDTSLVSHRATVPVDSVQQAVDVLIALRLLPLGLATAFEAGKRYANGEVGDCGHALWPIHRSADSAHIASGLLSTQYLTWANEEPIDPAPEPEDSGESPPWCKDCCTDEDPLTWCDCHRGQQCDGPCRQRAHDPAAHNAVPVVVPA